MLWCLKVTRKCKALDGVGPAPHRNRQPSGASTFRPVAAHWFCDASAGRSLLLRPRHVGPLESLLATLCPRRLEANSVPRFTFSLLGSALDLLSGHLLRAYLSLLFPFPTQFKGNCFEVQKGHLSAFVFSPRAGLFPGSSTFPQELGSKKPNKGR